MTETYETAEVTASVIDPDLGPGEQSSVPSGFLGDLGRRAAVAAALDLVGQYFATGRTLELESSQAPAWQKSMEDRDLNELVSALRLRVALAAAGRLSEILKRIVKRATFTYRQRSVDSIGELSGQLDINRYIAEAGTYAETVSFPIITVYRSTSTAENVLAVYASQWIVEELRSSLRASSAPAGGPEYVAWKSATDRMRQLLEQPQFAGCTTDAAAIKRRDSQRRLIDVVRRRLRRREIANPTPYVELLEWVERMLAGGPVAEAGDVEWLFYGERFDSKLFELWCLHRLGHELARALKQPMPPVGRGWRSGSPVYRFEGSFGAIDVHFQRGMGGRWTGSEGKALPGTPDIVVIAKPVVGVAKTALLDPKLKQRIGLPSDDVYKVLGYLQNFAIEPPVGFVLAHTTGLSGVSPDLYSDGEGGIVGAAKLNPVAAENVTSESLRPIVEKLVGLVGQK